VFAVGLERCTRRSRVDGTNRLLHPNRASTRSIPNWVFWISSFHRRPWNVGVGLSLRNGISLAV
jgi:hypothetical protein